MFDTLATYRKPILWCIIVLVVISFGLLGTFSMSSFSSAPNQAAPAITLDDISISRAAFREQLDQQLEQFRRTQPDATFKDLISTGAVSDTIQGLVSRAALDRYVAERPLTISREYLTEMLKKESVFQDADGNFDPKKYNDFIIRSERQGTNWNDLYTSYEQQIVRSINIRLLEASGRVLDSEVREAFATSKRRIRVSYVELDPPFELSDDEIRQHYSENPGLYKPKPEYVVDFFGISVRPERPEYLDTVAARAQAGDDFDAIAAEYPDVRVIATPGDNGWIRNSADLPERYLPALELSLNSASGIVESSDGYHLYRVVEELTSELSSERDVKIIELRVSPTLTQEERQEKRQFIESLRADVQSKEGDLLAVASENGLEVKRSGRFSSTSESIENVPAEDTLFFRTGFGAAEMIAGEIPNPLLCRNNYYVAKVVETFPLDTPSVEDIWEKVKEDAERFHKQSPEYREKLETLSQDLTANLKDLEALKTLKPDLPVAIKTTSAFGISDNLFSEQLYWNASQVFQALNAQEVGTVFGPVVDFRGAYYFVELIESTEADDAVWETEWPTERIALQEQIKQARAQARLSGAVEHLRKHYVDEGNAKLVIRKNVLADVMGVDMAELENLQGTL